VRGYFNPLVHEVQQTLGASGGQLRFLIRRAKQAHQPLGRPVRIITLEPIPQLPGRPEHRAVGGVVQHLRDDLTPGARITGPLYLDERRNRILVHSQMAVLSRQ
jgi:hypothetical protein